MKILQLTLGVVAVCLPGGVRLGQASTTIDAVNQEAYGSNVGWINFYADGSNGAVIGNYACSGYVYSANVGWINLGSGSPANGIYYQNLTASDFGVNNTGVSTPGYFGLRGYAYGANIGWINFENTGGAGVNMLTGQLIGYAWSANCGWISLDSAYAYVQTDTLYPGLLATNGLPIPWLLTYFGTTNVNPNSDPNDTGMTVGQDYLAGTDPETPESKLVITSAAFSYDGLNASVTWESELDRLYRVQETKSLSPANWQDSGLGLIVPSGATTTVSFPETGTATRFYRMQAIVPLQ